jgi:hypothetical protein
MFGAKSPVPADKRLKEMVKKMSVEDKSEED